MTDKSRVSIGQLSLRVPGTDAGFGQRVASEVGLGLARRLPAGASGHFEALELRVQANSLDAEGVSEAVVQALLSTLKGRTP